MMELLSNPAELESSLPSGNGGNIQNSSAVATLKSLMEEVRIWLKKIFRKRLKVVIFRLTQSKPNAKPSSPN